ncbi:hypothetical protein CBA19CS11_37865 [Caballeronia novacaledonica]|nr:hypothetical protein CBA19CS11_37865 [Caballeronia novacaledonica]
MHLFSILQSRKRTTRSVGVAVCIAFLMSPLSIFAQSGTRGVAFSAAEPAAPLPAGWKNLPVVKGKPITEYTLVRDGQTTVLQADANRSASAPMHEGDIDLAQKPVVGWRWKAEGPIEGADNRVGGEGRCSGETGLRI